MSSQVDICNRALSFLGVTPIASILESSNQAVRLNIVYSDIRDAVLRDFPWGFARRVETLGQLSTETVPGWNYVYTYPPKCMRVVMLFEDATISTPQAVEFKEFYTLTGLKTLAANISPAYAEYTYQVVDTTLYDPDFVEAFALKLAAETAYVLTGNLEMGPEIEKRYDAKISEAKRKSANEKFSTPAPSSSFEDARS